MRHLSQEGKITIFKSLALSKIVHLALLTIVQNRMKSRKSFYGQIKNVKIKHGTLRNDYKKGGLKNVDINHQIVSLKCLWIRRLYHEFHNSLELYK